MTNTPTPDQTPDGSESSAPPCSASLEQRISHRIMLWAHAQRGVLLNQYSIEEIIKEELKAAGDLKCSCGEESTGWTTVKCCNVCGNPHADDPLSWSFSL